MDYEIGAILYLYDISQDRFVGAPQKQLDFLARICRAAEMSKVVFVSTKWGRMDEVIAVARERDMSTTYWSEMVQEGALTASFNPAGEASARKIMDMVLLRNQRNKEFELPIIRDDVRSHGQLRHRQKERLCPLDRDGSAFHIRSRKDIKQLVGLVSFQ